MRDLPSKLKGDETMEEMKNLKVKFVEEFPLDYVVNLCIWKFRKGDLEKLSATKKVIFATLKEHIVRYGHSVDAEMTTIAAPEAKRALKKEEKFRTKMTNKFAHPKAPKAPTAETSPKQQ